MSSAAGQDTAVALRRAAVRATLAPSVRNTQPWRFVLRDEALEIHADWGRRLRVVDPHGHRLLMSCGAAIFNARVSLAASGYETVADRYPDSLRPDLVTRLTIGDRCSARDPIGELDAAVEARHSNRHEFTDDPVPTELVDRLALAALAEGATLVTVASTADRLAVARLTDLADSLERADPAYRAERQAWAAGDPQHRDAIPGPGRCLLLIGSTRDTPLAWVSVGEALERMLLEITRRGYVASALTQAVEVDRTHALLRSELALTMHPGLLLRVGRAAATVATRRRRLVDLIDEPAA